MLATERLNLRTTAHAKAVIEQASQLMGVSTSNFIIDVAYQRAVEMLNEQQTIRLNADEWARAIDLLEQPPKANAKLQALFDKGYRVANQ